MTRPTVTHDGFLIPNASGVAEPVLAEPDQIDFNTLANARWGVIEGCEVNAQGAKTVAIQGGTAIVDGKLVRVVANQLPLPTPGANSQFVLIVVDSGGVLRVKEGVASIDPVFPDPDLDQTVLASVYCDATSGDFSSNIVDKRKLLSDALLTKVAPTADLIRNINGTADHFRVDGAGKTTWETDTRLYRSAPQTVTIEDYLVVDDISTGDIHASRDVEVTGLVTSSNHRRGTVLPPSANNGDMFMQTNTGNLYVWFDGAWSQFASMDAAQGIIPFGTVIYSMQIPSVMRPLGWYPLNGTEQILEAQHEQIFTMAIGGTVVGTAPNRTMTLPNLNRRTMIVDFVAPAQLGGRAGNKLTLTTDMMPAHDHKVGGASGITGNGGGHTPAAQITAGSGTHGHIVSGGYHDHPVYDPGHRHESQDWYGQAAPTIAWVEFPGSTVKGKNKLDALFNDSSHTYTVEPIRWSMKAVTGINIGPNYEHSHGISGGGHDHAVVMSAVAAHYHTVSEVSVGKGQEIDITPLNFTVYAYIRA